MKTDAVRMRAMLAIYRLPTLRKFIRPIDERIGSLPDVTSGIPSVAEWEASAKE
jgi:hypothetical protein